MPCGNPAIIEQCITGATHDRQTVGQRSMLNATANSVTVPMHTTCTWWSRRTEWFQVVVLGLLADVEGLRHDDRFKQRNEAVLWLRVKYPKILQDLTPKNFVPSIQKKFLSQSINRSQRFIKRTAFTKLESSSSPCSSCSQCDLGLARPTCTKRHLNPTSQNGQPKMISWTVIW